MANKYVEVDIDLDDVEDFIANDSDENECREILRFIKKAYPNIALPYREKKGVPLDIYPIEVGPNQLKLIQ